EVDFQFMVGGQWVAHPGDDGVTYTVNVVDHDHPITHGVEDFNVTSEKYYMHIDPAIHVIATTDFDGVAMPIAWTKRGGKGNVFYCSLGHQPAIVEQPPVLQLIRQGMVWAAAPPEGRAGGRRGAGRTKRLPRAARLFGRPSAVDENIGAVDI